MSEPGHRERGFTMLELVIAGFLAVVIMGAAVTWLKLSRENADRTSERADASIAVDHAVERLRTDLAAARARDRAADAVYDPLEFATAIRTGGTLRGFDGDGVTARTLDVHDVVEATGTSIVFSASVPDGTQCVRWRVAGGELVREELGAPNRGCSPTLPVSSTRVLVRRSSDGRSALAAPFAFVVATPAPGAAGTCSSQTVSSVTRTSLGTVLAVLVDVQSLAGRVDRDARSGRQVRIDLRSRLAEEYQRALGCAR